MYSQARECNINMFPFWCLFKREMLKKEKMERAVDEKNFSTKIKELKLELVYLKIFSFFVACSRECNINMFP